MEHVPLLPGGDGVVHGRHDAVVDQLRDEEERLLVEDLVVRLPLVRVPDPRPPGVDLPLELLEGPIVNHAHMPWSDPP